MPDYVAQLNLRTRIGGGQFGDVYDADCPLHGKVAVKLLRQRSGETDVDWAVRSTELLAEARKLKSAQHRNIVAVYQVVKDTRGVVHLVTEFCKSGSLEAEYLASPMTLQKARKVITHACAGLECIHSGGMVHRDIKPANILCDDGTYKIADFGLVTDRMLHGYASAVGYVSHLAPEVFDSASGAAGVTSAKTDVWALGMTLYRLLHGHCFFLDNFGLLSADDFKQKIVDGGFSHSLPWLPHIPDKWRKFIRKSMHDDPSQRFQSAHDMSQALAPLPIDPHWNCQYVYNQVTWKKSEDGRTTTVVWQIQSPRKHIWTANRSGGGKNPRCVGGTRGTVISTAEARKQLEDFFAGVA
jgi:serine/threonine-protein kinase